MTIVFKLSENVKNLVIKHYLPYRKEKTPPYAVFQAAEADTIITLYESGKIMFQGISADIDAQIWAEQERRLNNRFIDIKTGKEVKEKKENPKQFFNCSTIGSDEVGTGDYFGPIVVTATYVSKENIKLMTELGVRDSKKLTDDKIKAIAPTIIQKIPYSTFVLDNESYNKLDEQNKNMNKIKAILHNKALVNIIKQDYQYDKIVVDQFVYPKKYYEHIKDAKEKATNITFMTKAEDQVMSVAAASIISRYIFLGKMQELSTKVGTILPLGAGTEVDKVAKELVTKNGMSYLNNIAKLNFKNTIKIQGE